MRIRLRVDQRRLTGSGFSPVRCVIDDEQPVFSASGKFVCGRLESGHAVLVVSERRDGFVDDAPDPVDAAQGRWAGKACHGVNDRFSAKVFRAVR